MTPRKDWRDDLPMQRMQQGYFRDSLSIVSRIPGFTVFGASGTTPYAAGSCVLARLPIQI